LLSASEAARVREVGEVAEQLPPTGEQSIGQLLRRIINGLNGIVDRQVQLVKQEIKEDILEVLGAGKTLAIGAGIAVVGLLMLLNVVTMAIVLSLNMIWPWLGWIVIVLLIGVIMFVAFLFAKRGLREIRVTPIDRTRRTLKEDARWARQLLTRNGK
jgi:uncharacterized membrane protein YqjE